MPSENEELEAQSPELEEEIKEPIEDDEEEDDDEGEDGEESEKEGKEDKEDDEEELTRVSYGEVKEKFPTLFKEYPTLKHAFFREQQFTELFPSIEEAKKAVEDQLQLQEITEAIIDGNADKFITELRKESPEGLEQFAQNFLPALRNVSNELYTGIVGPAIQSYIKNVFDYGTSEKDDNIRNAAKIVHKIIFGGGYDDVERANANGHNTNGAGRKGALDEDKNNFIKGKYQTLYSEVTNTCYSGLDTEIERGLSDLDKGNKGLKKLILNEVKNKVLQEMDKDQAYLSRMQSVWKREQRSGFNGTLKDSFRTIFMAKAKTLIPKVRSEVRREALGKNAGKEGKEPNRLSGGKQSSKSSGKAMTSERQRTEKLTSRQVFDD